MKLSSVVLFALIVLSSFDFLYQHILEHGWDVMVYEMNGWRYCGKNHYFEWYRPPFLSLFFCELQALGLDILWYHLATSILFVGGVFMLARKWGLNPFFAAIIAFSSPIFLNQSAFTGSDGLAVGFFILSLYYWPNSYSGVFFAMSVMSRYTMLILAPLFLFLDKKSLKPLALFALTLLPWLWFNYSNAGDPFYSFRESNLLNVANRAYMIQPVNLGDILLTVGIFILVFPFLIGSEVPIKLWAWTGLALLSYYLVPLKIDRYLLAMVPPMSMLASIGIEKLRSHAYYLLVFFTLINLSLNLVYPQLIFLGNYDAYYLEAARAVGPCASFSNVWVKINYFGGKACLHPMRLISNLILIWVTN